MTPFEIWRFKISWPRPLCHFAILRRNSDVRAEKSLTGFDFLFFVVFFFFTPDENIKKAPHAKEAAVPFVNQWFDYSAVAALIFHCVRVMQFLCLWGLRLCVYFYSLMKKQSSSPLFYCLPQTEEDYIPYPSVHEVGLLYAAIATLLMFVE